MLKYIVPLVLVGCYPDKYDYPAKCTTSYPYLRFSGAIEQNWGDCSKVGPSLEFVIQAFEDNVTDRRFLSARERLQGYQIHVRDDKEWHVEVHGETIQVNGTTRVEYKQIEISPVDWRLSGFAHELAHAIQDSTPTPFLDGKAQPVTNDDDHAAWVEDGIFKALDVVYNSYWEDNDA